MIACNFYKMKSNPYNVVITADIWDHDGATRTQGTIQIDGKVVEWYLGDWIDEHNITPVFIDGVPTALPSCCSEGKEGSPHEYVCWIFAALAERHCPETSEGRMGADYGEEGCCPVCAANHELAVYDVVQALRTQGFKMKMANVNDDGSAKSKTIRSNSC